MTVSRQLLANIGICLTIGIAFGIGYSYFLPKLSFNLKLNAHQESSVVSGMRALYQCIDNAALMNPRSFADSVGSGIHTNVLNLPSVILTNFIYSTNDIAHLFLDQWQRPYVVSIRPLPGPKTNVLWFDVRVWSCGVNGLDQGIKSDDVGSDIYSEQRRLRIGVP